MASWTERACRAEAPTARKLAVLLALICTLARVLDGAAPDTRLIDAVRRVDANAVQRLIEQKVDVNVTQPDGATALHWAAHRNEPAQRWTPPTRAASRRSDSRP